MFSTEGNVASRAPLLKIFFSYHLSNNLHVAYVAEQVIGSQEGKAVLPSGASVAHVGPITTFLDFLGDNAISTNPVEVENTLKRSPITNSFAI